MYKIFITVVLLITGLLLFHPPAPGQDESGDELVTINAMNMDSWKMQSFSLGEDATLAVKAIGQAINDQWYAKAWIINAQTRLPVWEMTFDNTQKINERGWRIFSGDVQLPAAAFEVYYGIDHSIQTNPKGISGFIDGLLQDLDYYDNETIIPRIDIAIPQEIAQNRADSLVYNRHTLLQITGVKNNQNQVKGFSLKNDMQIHVYMLGEGSVKSGQMYDYGWITNADSRERVWEAAMRNSEHAGGAEKNRLITETITLPQGNYLVHYMSDDSHSSEEFNQMPPYDPANWGITLVAGDSEETESVAEYVQERQEIKPIVAFTKVGNNASLQEGFTLLKDTRIRITAVGEYSRMLDRFSDYGWILDAHTRNIVWTMTRKNTTHAGGSIKNRQADENILLPAGSYLVYFVTDDSHSCDEWNSSPPSVPDNWGIMLRPVEESFRKTDYQPYNEKTDPDILVAFLQVGNKEHRRKTFHLDRNTRLSITAIGEGDKTEMYDYGWIEDDNRKIVWIMEFAKTEHAGGAKKNRLTRETIILGPGAYTAHFETDNNHSFNNWNADRPDNYFNWGLLIVKDSDVEKQYRGEQE
ncbi:MAG TPA: hypothetical protein PLP19_20740 [bacterium]|nr:hypothetical protein [bacterium]HPN45924.1 hypothetical protein [bacterium]